MKLIIVFFMFLIIPFSVPAMSKAEQYNYNKIHGDYIIADKKLNNLYKIQIQQYEKEGGIFYGQTESRAVYLKKSQQIWIKMRDVNCNYETYESMNGTGYSSIYSKCLLDKTNERIKYLTETN